MVSLGGGGGPVGDGEETHCLWSPPIPGHLLQVPGASSCIRGRQLSGSGAQPLTRQVEVGASNSAVEKGGRGYLDIGTNLIGGGESVPAIRVRDMGPDTTYAEGVGRIQP